MLIKIRSKVEVVPYSAEKQVYKAYKHEWQCTECGAKYIAFLKRHCYCMDKVEPLPVVERKKFVNLDYKDWE